MLRKLLLFALALLLSLPWHANAQVAGITPCAAKTLAVTTSTGNVQLSNCGPVVIVYNISSQEAFYNLGSSSGTAATTSSFSVPGNTFVVLQVTPSYYLAAITASSTTTLRITQGWAQP